MAKNVKVNKRGDISITLLVIGVFAVCTLAIVSFLLQNQISQGGFADIETMERLFSQAEDFYFHVNSGLTAEEAAERIGAEIQDGQLILTAEQKESEFFGFLTGKEPKTVLSVQYAVDLSN